MSENTEKKESWGAWKKQTPKGEVINFTLEGKRFSMWVNSYKTEEKQPDFKIYLNDYVAPTNTSEDLKPKASDLPF
jgi:hypothetical protein